MPDTTGTIDANGESVTLAVTGYNTAQFNLSGTWSGTLVFESSTNGGSSYAALSVRPSDPPRGAVTATAQNGAFDADVAPYTHIRVKATSFSSGSASVSIHTAIADDATGSYDRFDQSLNTTDSPTFAGVTLQPASGTAEIKTSDGVDPNAVHLKGGNATTGNGAQASVSAGNSADPDGGSAGSIQLAGGNLTGAATASSAGGVIIAGGSSYSSVNNLLAGGVEIAEGSGSGNAVGFGITFKTSTPGASGATLQDQATRGTMLVDVFTWDGAMKLSPRAFAALPAAPEEGMLAWVNDSSTATWGATIAGGGANKVLAVYNGSAWTCAGK